MIYTILLVFGLPIVLLVLWGIFLNAYFKAAFHADERANKKKNQFII